MAQHDARSRVPDGVLHIQLPLLRRPVVLAGRKLDDSARSGVSGIDAHVTCAKLHLASVAPRLLLLVLSRNAGGVLGCWGEGVGGWG